MHAIVVADRSGEARIPAALVAETVDALGTSSFLPALLAGFNTLGAFPFLFAGRERQQGSEFAPCVGYGRPSFESPATLSLRTVDGSDPMRCAMRCALDSRPAGTVFIASVDASEIADRRRRELIFERHALATRIGMSTLGADGARYFLCLYRHDARATNQSHDDELKAACLVALRLLRKHWQIQDLSRSVSRTDALPACDALSERERQVCAALLRGRTLPQLADMLGIRTSTARTYQQRAFARLGIRSRRELFAMIDSAVP